MNFSKKNHELVRQNEKIVKKAQKHDVNLRKNSTMYFQIGLIICLLATYFVMNMKFETSEIGITNGEGEIEVEKVFAMKDYEIYKQPAEKIKPKVKRERVVIDNNIRQVKNDFVELKPVEVVTPNLNTTDQPKTTLFDSGSQKNSLPTIVNINNVDQVPIFPGCEGLSTNSERKTCMSNKITKLVQRKFNTSLGEGLGLTGKQKINVEFKIDENGNVTGIKSRAIHPILEKEAERVVGKIPKMEAGKQQNKNVTVLYNLPIVFQVYN